MNAPTATRAIGDRPLSLATHLRATIDLLLDQGRSGYKWCDTGSCNAGLIACVITGYTRQQLVHAVTFAGPVGCWNTMMRDICPHNTGRPWPAVYQQLLNAGLEPSDPGHLELLNHPELADPSWTIRNVGFGLVGAYRNDGQDAYSNPECVAAYMLRWVGLIETFHAEQSVSDAHGAEVGIALTETLAAIEPALP